MKPATVHEIKKGLQDLDEEQLQALCLRLARFKQDNKELLTYLLFDAGDEQSYIRDVEQEITDEFEALSNFNVYHVKKSVRRILRMVNKQIRYSGQPTTELAVRIHFCRQMKASGIPLKKSPVLQNLYDQQLKKIGGALKKLENDLQYDYREDIEALKP